MDKARPYVLTVAGFDPSAGAGILADVKTFEQNGVYGLAICTAMTLQTENEFISAKWTERDELFTHIRKMLLAYPVVGMKTGIMPSLNFLREVIAYASELRPEMKIVVDPIIKSTTGFAFMSEVEQSKLESLLKQIRILTPNYHEAKKLSGKDNIEEAGLYLSRFCDVVVKGGHNSIDPGTDTLYTKGEIIKIAPGNSTIYPKHGSGCVFSAALTSNIAKGQDIESACRHAKTYTELFLSGTDQLLGYHA